GLFVVLRPAGDLGKENVDPSVRRPDAQAPAQVGFRAGQVEAVESALCKAKMVIRPEIAAAEEGRQAERREYDDCAQRMAARQAQQVTQTGSPTGNFTWGPYRTALRAWSVHSRPPCCGPRTGTEADRRRPPGARAGPCPPCRISATARPTRAARRHPTACSSPPGSSGRAP